MKSLGLVPNHAFMGINIKVTQVFLMHKLSCTKSGAELLKINFLARPIGMGGPLGKLALNRLIWELG
jgi:hypothetical protein